MIPDQGACTALDSLLSGLELVLGKHHYRAATVGDRIQQTARLTHQMI